MAFLGPTSTSPGRDNRSLILFGNMARGCRKPIARRLLRPILCESEAVVNPNSSFQRAPPSFPRLFDYLKRVSLLTF